MFFLYPTIAQQQKAEENFVNALNNFASVSKSQHWAHGESVLESPFKVIGDSITATFRYRGDSSDYRLRFTAPIKQLKSVDVDVFLIMVFRPGQVVIYRSDVETSNVDYWTTDMLFHVGKVESEKDELLKQKVMDAWEELQNSRE